MQKDEIIAQKEIQLEDIKTEARNKTRHSKTIEEQEKTISLLQEELVATKDKHSDEVNRLMASAQDNLNSFNTKTQDYENIIYALKADLGNVGAKLRLVEEELRLSKNINSLYQITYESDDLFLIKDQNSFVLVDSITNNIIIKTDESSEMAKAIRKELAKGEKTIRTFPGDILELDTQLGEFIGYQINNSQTNANDNQLKEKNGDLYDLDSKASRYISELRKRPDFNSFVSTIKQISEGKPKSLASGIVPVLEQDGIIVRNSRVEPGSYSYYFTEIGEVVEHLLRPFYKR